MSLKIEYFKRIRPMIHPALLEIHFAGFASRSRPCQFILLGIYKFGNFTELSDSAFSWIRTHLMSCSKCSIQVQVLLLVHCESFLREENYQKVFIARRPSIQKEMSEFVKLSGVILNLFEIVMILTLGQRLIIN